MSALPEFLQAAALLGPLGAAVRILAIFTFGGLMIGFAVPWRYRIGGALLLGWAAAGDSPIADSLAPGLLAAELALGAAIGIGAGAVLAGLRLAGELIEDRLRLGEAASDGLDGNSEPAGPCVRLLAGLAVTLVLFGGDGASMPVLEGILASFRTTPVGAATGMWETWRGVASLLGASAEMAIRTALPVLGAVTIVDWCQVLAARAATTAPSALVATAVKPLLGLAILVASFGGVCDSAMKALQLALAGDWAG